MWQWHWLTEKGRSNTARRNHCFHASVQESWAKNTPSVTSCLNRYFTARLNSLSGHFCHYIGSFWLIDRVFCFCFYTVLFSAIGLTLVAYDSKWVTVGFHSVWAKFNVHKKKWMCDRTKQPTYIFVGALIIGVMGQTNTAVNISIQAYWLISGISFDFIRTFECLIALLFWLSYFE